MFAFVVLAVGDVQLVDASDSAGSPYSSPHFLEYWAASRLLIQGGNPYSPAELLTIQQTAGWGRGEPVIMWNPPWTLWFTLPFGLFDFELGRFVWLLVQVFLILFSAQNLWRLYANAPAATRLPFVLAVTFVSAFFCLITEQISPLVLAGLTAFLCFENKQQWIAMGAALVVCAIKPHLLYLVWIVFILWLWQNRNWQALLGSVLAGMGAALFPVLFDAAVYQQYAALYQIPAIPRPLDWLTPTMRSAVRVFIGPGQIWLQILPSLAAIAWVLNYWRQHRHRWSWPDHLPLIVLASVTTSIFAWTYDQVVFFPAIMQAAAWLKQRAAPWHGSWAARLYIGINLCQGLQRIWIADELWYFWLAPALLLNYLIFRWESSAE